MSTNFVGNTLTQSEAIETYTPYDVTSSRPWKTTIAFFANFGGTEKLFCALGQSLHCKFENYESVQHGLQFSGIKKGAKISFHRHFKNLYPSLFTFIKLYPDDYFGSCHLRCMSIGDLARPLSDHFMLFIAAFLKIDSH